MDEPLHTNPLYLRDIVRDIYDQTPGRRVLRGTWMYDQALWYLRARGLIQFERFGPIAILTAAGIWLAERSG